MADEETTQAEATSSEATEAEETNESEAESTEETFDKDRALSTIRQQRENERKLTRELNKIKADLKKHEDAKLSETQKLQRDLEDVTKERDDIRRELRQLRAQKAVMDAGALYPDLVAAKVPDEALDDAKELKAALVEIKKSYPRLFGATNGSADGGAGTTTSTKVSMNDMIRRKAGRH